MPKNIYARVRHYANPKNTRRLFEVTITLIATLGLAAGAYLTFIHSPLFAMLFIPPLGLFLVRCFIMQHDCSHGALFEKRSANRWLGRALSLFSFTPFEFWRWSHMMHHKSNANLDQRGIGDIFLLTVQEYRDASKFQKLLYRLSRHPAILLLLLAPLYFLAIMRFNFSYYSKSPGYKKSATHSIYLTNVALAVFYGGLCYLLGYQFILFIFLPSLLLAAVIGTWLFYVQHNFPDSYFKRETTGWDHLSASLHGSSYYKLPWILEWLTGYIGYHHIHHFNAKVPFYRLREAFLKVSELQSPKTYSIKDSITLAKLALYDETAGRFITWNQYHQTKWFYYPRMTIRLLQWVTFQTKRKAA